MITKQVLLIGIAVSIAFIFVFLNQLILNIDKPLSDPDNMYQYFLIENNLSKFISFDLAHLYETRMFYPLKNTLALGNSQFIQSLLALPAYLVTKNVIVSAHFMILINFFLAFLMMFFLVFHFTKSIGVSILGGLIFSYNPYVMAQFYFELLTIFWIPLIFLTTESFLKKPTLYKGVALPILFLLQLVSSFYYALFIALMWPVYLTVRLHRERTSVRRLLNKGLLIGGVMLLIGGFLYLKPYIDAKKSFQVTRSLEGINLHSAKPIDFLATSPYNKVYGKLTESDGLIGLLRGQDLKSYYQQHYTEHSLFPGIVVYGLLITSLALLVRGKFSSQTKLAIPLLVVLLVAILFSFGPSLPLYLLMYKFVPFVDSLRVPSRFMVMGFFALAVLASLAASFWLGKLGPLRPRSEARKLGRLGVISLLIFLISLEYQHQLAAPFIIKPEIRQFYEWLDTQDGIKVIIELPMANDLSNYPSLFRNFFDESKYLLYGIYHQKQLVNGNATFIPPDVILLGRSLTVGFPTGSKIEQLKNMGVDAIVVHKEEYKDTTQAQEAIIRLRRFDLQELYKSPDITLFTLR